ncbi:NAD(P)/FAD-dependent oxidoreductase [Alkalibacillus almallahensis]|uniref:NAD(P)/FAD-dependent oxidoreductase n=1 Tax=Alkalibacillus almallahensis TaxID=1379154 RepID=UPI0014200E7F|nr:FAD-binding oxidoreductase [Alkalibacillus almallahensis]NIK13169.1 D-amino-acid dehydrogenase [Alkalibacillus almallahensis]
MTHYLVVGAGILGSSVAYHLAKANQQVTIIDYPNNGEATRAAAGIISPWLSQKQNETLYQLLKHGAAYYQELNAELNTLGIQDTSYKQVESIHLHKSEDKLAKMVDDTIARKKDAPEIGDVQQLSEEVVAESTPVMTRNMGGIKISGGGRVNGAVFRDALLNGAEIHGADIIKGEAILNNDGATVTVNGQRIEADQLIITNGAWASSFLNKSENHLDIKSTKTQIVQLQLPGYQTEDWPVVMLPNNKYIVGFKNGIVSVGAEHRDNHDFNPTVDASSIHEILKAAFKFAPGLKEAHFIDAKVGFRPQTNHNRPVYGFLPHNPSIYVANGLGASGMTSGPFIGAEISRHLLGQQTVLSQVDFDPKEQG